MKITTEMVKQLRNETGAGVMEAKRALEATDGNFEEATEILKVKGADRAAERSDRAATEGVIEVYSHLAKRVGVMMEINCESDFVANNEIFQTLAHDLVLQIAAMEPVYIGSDDIPQETMDSLIAEFKEQALTEGKPADIAEKIVSGRLNKYYEEICLLEQPFVKDDEKKVKDLIIDAIRTLGENIVVRRFVRYELGEEL
jgi:elongation factor Ts